MYQLIRSVLELGGLDVRLRRNIVRVREEEKRRAARQKWNCLSRYRPRTILDIGANTGQFARLARELWPAASIICFEPLSDCFRELQSNLQADPQARAVQCALGNRTGDAVIHRSAFTPSSSLLSMGALHQREFPHTAQTTAETIQLRRLDDLAQEIDLQPPIIAKLDVQGYECEVLEGGRHTLRDCAALIVELSNYPLYDGQPLFDEVYALLKHMGFAFRGNVDQLLSPGDGRILQFDGLFENTLVHPDWNSGGLGTEESAP